MFLWNYERVNPEAMRAALDLLQYECHDVVLSMSMSWSLCWLRQEAMVSGFKGPPAPPSPRAGRSSSREAKTPPRDRRVSSRSTVPHWVPTALLLLPSGHLL